MEKGDAKKNHDLLSVIEVFGQHLAVSITNRCPLQCEHCISSSSPHTEIGHKALPDALYALLSQGNFKHVTLTGGEPFDDLGKLEAFAKICNQNHVRYGAITSAFWAKTEKSANNAMLAVPGISSLTISTDIYHTKYINPAFIKNAYFAATMVGARTSVRLTRNTACQQSDILQREIHKFIPEKDIEICQLAPYGRAEKNAMPVDRGSSTNYGKCPTSGSHIFEDGRITPCCNSIVSLRNHAFFNYGNIISDFSSSVDKMQKDVLFLIIKKIGFDFIDIFSKKNGIEIKRYVNACEFCFQMNKVGELSGVISGLMDSGMDIAGLSYLYSTTDNEEEKYKLALMMSALADRKLVALSG